MSEEGALCILMPQRHSTMDALRLLASIWFLARKAEWSACRNFTPQLGSVRLDKAVQLWLNWIIRRTPHGPRGMPVRASHWPRMGISNVFHIPRDPCRTRKGTVGHPSGHVMELTKPEFTKIPHGHHMWSAQGCSQSLNRMIQAPCVDVRLLFKTALEQPVLGPGVWCDWGINFTDTKESFFICMPGLNSFRPSDAIWHRGSWSSMVQVMACYLVAPRHYLNQKYW